MIIHMHAYTHGGWAHQQWVSTTFLTQKNSQLFLCSERGLNSDHGIHWILSPTFYQLSHIITPTPLMVNGIWGTNWVNKSIFFLVNSEHAVFSYADQNSTSFTTYANLIENYTTSSWGQLCLLPWYAIVFRFAANPKKLVSAQPEMHYACNSILVL